MRGSSKARLNDKTTDALVSMSHLPNGMTRYAGVDIRIFTVIIF